MELLGAIAAASRRQSEASARVQEELRAELWRWALEWFLLTFVTLGLQISQSGGGVLFIHFRPQSRHCQILGALGLDIWTSLMRPPVHPCFVQETSFAVGVSAFLMV